jgi:hypothetical protein
MRTPRFLSVFRIHKDLFEPENEAVFLRQIQLRPEGPGASPLSSLFLD